MCILCVCLCRFESKLARSTIIRIPYLLHQHLCSSKIKQVTLPGGDAGRIPEILRERAAGAGNALLRGGQGAQGRVGVEGPVAPGFAGQAVLEEHAWGEEVRGFRELGKQESSNKAAMNKTENGHEPNHASPTRMIES